MGSFSKLLPLRLGFVQLLRPSILLRSHELMTLVLLGVACWQFVDGSALIGLVCLLVISLVVARGSFYDVEPKKKIEEKNNDNLTTKEESEENGEKKYAVVTGGTHGIGEELVSQLKEQGFEVIACGRSAKGYYLDLGEAASIKVFGTTACCNRIKSITKNGAIDLVVLNAGVWNGSHTLTYDRMESTFQTNHFGHAYFLEMLMDNLKMSERPRVVVVSSLAAYGGATQGSVEDWQKQLYSDPPYFGYLVNFNRYCDSKLCNVLFAVSLKKLFPWITVVICHPGSSFTKLVAGSAYHFIVEFMMRILFKSPKSASQTPLFCSLAENLKSDAIYSEMSPMPMPIQATQNEADLLWKATEIEIKKMAEKAKIQVGDFKDRNKQ